VKEHYSKDGAGIWIWEERGRKEESNHSRKQSPGVIAEYMIRKVCSVVQVSNGFGIVFRKLLTYSDCDAESESESAKDSDSEDDFGRPSAKR